MTGTGTSPPSPPETDPPPPQADASSPEADASSPEADPWLYVGAGVLIGIVVLGALALVFIDTVRAGWWAFLTYNEQGSSTSELVQRWGVIFAALFAGGIAIWRAVIADRARATAEKEHLRQIRAGELSDQREVQRQDFDRFQRGALGLDSDNIAVRIASIATLLDLGGTSAVQYAPQVASLLESFLNIEGRKPDEEGKCRTDVRAAFLALCELQEIEIVPPANLKGLALQNIDLLNQKITNINFSKTDFSRAEIAGANFLGCTFVNCSLSGAYGSYASFGGCTFRHADFSHAVMVGTRFQNCSMRYVSFRAAVFAGSRFDATGIKVYLNVSAANLAQVSFDAMVCWAWADMRPMFSRQSRRFAITLFEPPDGVQFAERQDPPDFDSLTEISWEEAERRYPAPGVHDPLKD